MTDRADRHTDRRPDRRRARRSGRRTDHTVRPRGVWGGLLLAVLGLVALAVGGVATAGTWMAVWVAAGATLVVLGGALALHSGVLYAVHGPGQAADTAHEVLHGETYQGHAPGDQVAVSPEAREKARTLDLRRLELERRSAATPAPAFAPVGAVVLLLAAFGLLVASGAFFAHTAVGSANADRALGCAILAGAAGMRYLVSPGRHLVFATGALLGGLFLVLSGPLSPHDRPGTVALEVAVGTIVLLAAAVCLASPTSQDIRSDQRA